jgi:hypothetical protein
MISYFLSRIVILMNPMKVRIRAQKIWLLYRLVVPYWRACAKKIIGYVVSTSVLGTTRSVSVWNIIDNILSVYFVYLHSPFCKKLEYIINDTNI